MANTVKMKQSSVAGKVPTTAQLALGELAVNTYDGKLFLKKSVSGVETIIDVTAGADPDITAIAAISDSSTGYLRKTAANTWSVETSPTFDQVISTNNGNGTNYKVGDDAWIGDVNVSNTVRITGQQNAANGYIIFGNSDSTALGRAGTGALTYGGNTVLTSATSAATFPTLNQNTTGNAATATNVAWSGVTSKPTTRDGYGITDVPKTDGTGASGTWGINVTGNAATATTASTANALNTSNSYNVNGIIVNGLGGGAGGSIWGQYGIGVVNYDAAGFAVRITPTSTGTNGIIQWTNSPVTAQWTSLVGTNGNLQCTTSFSATSFSGSGSGLTGTASSLSIGGNAATAGGLSVATGRNNAANQIVRTDANGYLQTGYINSSNGDEGNNSSPARVWGTNGSDSYLRTYLTSALSVNYAASSGSCSGNAATSSELVGTATRCGYSTASATVAYTGAGGPQVMGDTTSASMISFHRAGAYAVNFGLDTDNVLKVGGWSMGAVSYAILHSNNYKQYPCFPSYSSAPTSRAYSTWYQAEDNIAVTVVIGGPYMNGFVAYAGPSTSTYWQIGAYGDDINSNTKYSTFSFLVKKGSYFYVNTENGYTYYTWPVS